MRRFPDAFFIPFGLALDHLCDLCAVILFSLLNALTLVETNIAEAPKVRMASHAFRKENILIDEDKIQSNIQILQEFYPKYIGIFAYENLPCRAFGAHTLMVPPSYFGVNVKSYIKNASVSRRIFYTFRISPGSSLRSLRRNPLLSSECPHPCRNEHSR